MPERALPPDATTRAYDSPLITDAMASATTLTMATMWSGWAAYGSIVSASAITIAAHTLPRRHPFQYERTAATQHMSARSGERA